MSASGPASVPSTGALLLSVESTGSLTDGQLTRLDRALESADLDPDVRCIVLRAVPGAASPDPLEGPSTRPLEVRHRLEASIRAARRIPKLIVYELDGLVEGEAVGLLAMADLVLATSRSVVRPGGVASALIGMLPALAEMGGRTSRALVPVLEGRELDAHAARDLGLVTDVVPPERLHTVLVAILDGIERAGPTLCAMLKDAAQGGAATR